MFESNGRMKSDGRMITVSGAVLFLRLSKEPSLMKKLNRLKLMPRGMGSKDSYLG